MYSAAVEKVLPPMPPPPATPACQGCTPRVDLHDANYSGTGAPQPGDVTSIFSLHFDGDCAYATGDAKTVLLSEEECHAPSVGLGNARLEA